MGIELFSLRGRSLLEEQIVCMTLIVRAGFCFSCVIVSGEPLSSSQWTNPGAFVLGSLFV